MHTLASPILPHLPDNSTAAPNITDRFLSRSIGSKTNGGLRDLGTIPSRFTFAQGRRRRNDIFLFDYRILSSISGDRSLKFTQAHALAHDATRLSQPAFSFPSQAGIGVFHRHHVPRSCCCSVCLRSSLCSECECGRAQEDVIGATTVIVQWPGSHDREPDTCWRMRHVPRPPSMRTGLARERKGRHISNICNDDLSKKLSFIKRYSVGRIWRTFIDLNTSFLSSLQYSHKNIRALCPRGLLIVLMFPTCSSDHELNPVARLRGP